MKRLGVAPVLFTRSWAWVLAGMLLGACEKPRSSASSDAHSKHSSHSHSHSDHAAPRPGVQSLDVFADGERLHVLVGELPADGSRSIVHHLRSDDQGETWSTPVRVDVGIAAPHGLKRGLDAHIAVRGDTMIAAWMSPGTDPWGGGPIALALSQDGGKNWTAGPNPADDGATDGHGFLDLAVAGDTFHITWLDSREGKRGLRYAKSSDGGRSWSPNATLDPETCECCSNTIVTDGSGTVAVLYRDKAPRDMGAAVSTDGGTTWRPSIVPAKFEWQFDGCPHAGGGLAIRGDRWLTTVWTGKADSAGLYFLDSRDRGTTWAAPVLIHANAMQSDVAIHPNGKAAVTWSADGRIYVTSPETPTSGQALTPEGRQATHPRIVSTQSGFRVFWTEKPSDSPAVWRSAPFKL